MPRHPKRAAAVLPGQLRPSLAPGWALGRAYLAFLFAVAVAETALRASGSSRPAGFRALTAAFLVGGAASGLLHERLIRSARTSTDALVAGAASAIPFLLCMRVAVRGPGQWTLAEGTQLAVLALLAGAVSRGRTGQLPMR